MLSLVWYRLSENKQTLNIPVGYS